VDFIGSILAGRKIRSSLIARRSGTAAIKVIAFCFLIFCFSILGGVFISRLVISTPELLGLFRSDSICMQEQGHGQDQGQEQFGRLIPICLVRR